jgi:hypothetical protein
VKQARHSHVQIFVTGVLFVGFLGLAILLLLRAMQSLAALIPR